MKNFYIALLLLCSWVSQAQYLFEDNTLTPKQLTENILAGVGVVPTNIKFNGSNVTAQSINQQAARWYINFNPVPVLATLGNNTQGVLLTTGQAIGALGPNNNGGATNPPSPMTLGDADLNLLSGKPIQNVAVLEFDFVATGLTINFDYIFGSDEYLEYVNSSFNDVFGFFLSGPGITGPYSNSSKNIALIPGGTTPVTIDNVNSTVNSIYYTNNGTGGTPLANPDVQYDGVTKLLRATSALQCGGTYHIKIAVANAGDTAFDSGVFLRNFSIPPLELTDNLGLPVNTAVCYGSTVTIDTGVGYAGNTYLWYSNGGTTLLPGETGPTLNVTTDGDYCVKIYTPGNCLLAEDCIQIAYLPPLPINNPVNMSICTNAPPNYTFNINQTAFMLGSQNASDYDITYYNSSYQDASDGVSTGIIPNGTLNNYSLTSASQTIWVRVEELSGAGCIAVYPFTLTANQIPLAPVVSSPITYCQNAVAVPLTATGANLLWYTTATGGVGSTTPFTPDTSAPGTINYYVSQTVSGCEGPRAAIAVTVYATPLPPVVTSPISYCQFAPATALTAIGSNLLWYTAATGGVGSATALIPNTNVAGSTTYYVSQTINGCEGPRTPLVVDVLAALTAPIVTSPVEYCQNETAVPLTATGVGLLWYDSITDLTGDPIAPTPITTTAPYTTTYYVSQTATGCEGPKAPIVVTVFPTPIEPVVAPVYYCENAIAVPLTAIGTSLLWYDSVSDLTGDPIAPTPVTTPAGTTTYYVTQTTAAGCEGPKAAITVTVYAPPLAPAVTSPVNYCQFAPASPLTATGSLLLWYTTATGGIGTTTAFTPNTNTVGSTTYYVSQNINGCEGPRAAIVVDVLPVLTAPITAPVDYCQNEIAVPLTATGVGLLWYDSITDLTGDPVAPTPITSVAPFTTTYYVSQSATGCEGPKAPLVVTIFPTPLAPTITTPVYYCQNAISVPLTATGTSLLWYDNLVDTTGDPIAPTPITSVAGTTTYYVTQTSAAGCESPKIGIDVTVYGTPLPPTAVTPIGYCQNVTATPLSAVGSSLLWYTVPTGGTASALAPTPITTNVGSTSYYVSQTINGCEGPRTEIIVNVSLTPIAPAVTSPVTYCQNASAVALSATGTNLLWYTSLTGVGSTTAIIPSTLIPGSFTYYVSQTLNGCEGPKAAIVVDVLPTPTAPTVNSPVTYCLNAIAVPLTATGTNLLWYDSPSDLIGDPMAPTPSTALAGNTTYYVSQTVNGCEGPRANIIVTVIAPPLAPAVISPIGYCQFETAAPLTATGANLLWYTFPTGGIASTTLTPSTAVVGTTTYYVSQTVNGCEGPRAAIAVTISVTPLAPIVTTPITYCQNDVALPLTATGSNLLWYTDATGGVGSTIAPTPSTTTAGTTTYYVTQTTNSCESPRAAINIIVNPLPTPSLDQNGFVCVDSQTNMVLNTFTLDSGLSNSGYTFVWYVINAGAPPTVIPLATANNYVVSVPGNYGVIATNTTTTCVSDIATANVGISSPPVTVDAISSSYFVDGSITVNATPPGNYEYQLDSGAFQSSNVFTNVSAGTHVVTVRDVNDCGSLKDTVEIIDFPKFFTPNGDGFNDTWNISALSGQPNSKISIFDRFGKLVKQISPSGSGWDGTFNGKPLTSTDYWFVVDYTEAGEEKTFKSHFSLKR